jgi:hypothetical protein
MITKWVLATVAFLGALTLSFAASVSPYYSRIHVVTGRIERFDQAQSVLILRPDGSDLPVKYSIEVLGTRIRRDDRDIILEALRPGQRAIVYFRLKRGGRNAAVKISLVSASNSGAARCLQDWRALHRNHPRVACSTFLLFTGRAEAAKGR